MSECERVRGEIVCVVCVRERLIPFQTVSQKALVWLLQYLYFEHSIQSFFTAIARLRHIVSRLFN